MILYNGDMPIAYAYSRYSSEPQGKGDSIRRQNEMVEKYLLQHPELELNTDPAFQFSDQGVSAFTGKHVKSGAFSRFLGLVMSGHIEPGSYLLVEQFDRLSRQEPMKALTQFNALLQEDIIIVTLNDGKEYSKESILADGGMSLMMSLMHMIKSHDESKSKGLRVKQAWSQKMKRVDEGIMLTRRLPFWIDPDSHKKLNRKKLPVIKKIFNMASKGYGATAIAKQLNADGFETATGRAKYWSSGTIKKLLQSQSVIGTLVTGDGVEHPGYFPVAIPEALFKKVNNITKSSRAIRSPKASLKGMHPLAGLIYCSKCGGAAHHVSKQGKQKADGTKTTWRYAVCAQSMESDQECKYQSMPYIDIVLSVVRAIEEHEYSDAQGDTFKEIKVLEDRARNLSAKIDFHTDFKTAIGKKQYGEALNEYDQGQKRLKELKESRSPLSARLFKSTKQAIVCNRNSVTNNLLRQMIHRVDLDFSKRKLVVHFNDNGKERVGLDDYAEGFDNPPGWSEIKARKVK
jgi:DNA invertase Pin-like site-specific DNA recombinase